jgi:hypothetical protein
MKLQVANVQQTFIPIRQFRETHHLDNTFGVSLFEPKDYTGLGSLDDASEPLKQLREMVLQSIPKMIHISDLIRLADQLQVTFQNALTAINDRVQLRESEVDFAVAGFGDVLQAMIYKMIPNVSQQKPTPSFDIVYRRWINDSVRVSSHVHEYETNGDVWQVRIVTQVYGRVGLQVTIGDHIVYVLDAKYLCPAEGFMFTLLRDVTMKIWNALDQKVG